MGCRKQMGALVAVVAALAAVAPPAHAAQGVVPSGAVAGATVKIEMAGNPDAAPGETRERACSGALVAASWVLTAASCFADAGGKVSFDAPPWPTTATVGRPDLTATSGKVATVDRLVPHPVRDVVMVRLASKVTTAPVVVATTPPAVGDTLTVAGFGRTADAVVPDTVHAAAYTVEALGDGVVDIAPAQDDAAICKGDAGGPALRATDTGGVELVAIHHTAYQGGCLGAAGTRRDATETRVDDLGRWIAAAMAPKPGESGFTEAYVATLYRDVLKREAGSGNIAHWATRLDQGETLRDITVGIVDSLSWRRVFVTDTYVTLLGRQPTDTQRDIWVSRYDGGMDTFAITHHFVSTAEYYARAGSTDTGLVQALHRDLLGRDATAVELTHWTDRAAQQGRTAVLQEFVHSDEYRDRVVDQADQQMLGRSPDPNHLRSFGDMLQEGGDIPDLLVRLAVTSEYRIGRVWGP